MADVEGVTAKVRCYKSRRKKTLKDGTKKIYIFRQCMVLLKKQHGFKHDQEVAVIPIEELNKCVDNTKKLFAMIDDLKEKIGILQNEKNKIQEENKDLKNELAIIKSI